MWQWLAAHFSIWLDWTIFHLPYFYEFLGGVLIFASSAVTETRLPRTRQKCWHWILFGAFSLVFVGCGIIMRHGELKLNAKNGEPLHRIERICNIIGSNLTVRWPV